MSDTQFTFKDALLDPSAHYAEPKEVAMDQRFTKADHRRILQAWQANEEALLRAANEGMDGGERPHLQLVALELQRLDEQKSR